MMTGNAFVISDRFNIQQEAMFRIPFIYVDVTGMCSVRCAVGVVGWDAVLGARSLHGDRDKLRFWQTTKKFWKLRLHVVNVFGVEVEHLLAGSSIQLSIILYVFVEARQIVKSELLRERQHLSLRFLKLLQADFVYLVGSQVGGGHASNRVTIASIAIGKSPNARLGAAMRSVFIPHERNEALVSSDDLI